MVLEGSAGEGLGFHVAFSDNEFHRQVEEDCTEGAALLNTRVNGD